MNLSNTVYILEGSRNFPVSTRRSTTPLRSVLKVTFKTVRPTTDVSRVKTQNLTWAESRTRSLRWSSFDTSTISTVLFYTIGIIGWKTFLHDFIWRFQERSRRWTVRRMLALNPKCSNRRTQSLFSVSFRRLKRNLLQKWSKKERKCGCFSALSKIIKNRRYQRGLKQS